MTQHLVLTIIGEDKPGLVEALSQTIVSHQGNWLESRMSHLADKFAGILTVSVPDEQQKALVKALNEFEKTGLKVVVETATVPVLRGRQLSLSLIGNDKPGIVKEVSQVLHSLSVNVKELTTQREPAPMSSDMLFKAQMQLTVPPSLSLLDLEGALESISSDLMIEVMEEEQ